MDLEFLQRRARGLLSSLTERFRELECRDYPSADTTDALRHLRKMLGQVQNKLSAAGIEETKLFIKAAIEWQKLLVHFDNAHTEQTPRALVRVLEKLLVVHNISGKKCGLIAAPAADDYNYSISDLAPQILKPIEKMFSEEEKEDSANDFLKFFSNPLFVITFPRVERDNILAHGVFGHEIGHLVAEICLEDPSMKKLLEGHIAPVRDELIKKIGGKRTSKTVRAAVQLLDVRDYWKRGMEELISDYVGLLLFGPSALFAFHWVISHRNLDKLPSEPGFYPPNRQRLRFGLETMREEGFWKAFKAKPPVSSKAVDCYPSVLKFVQQLQRLADDKADRDAIQVSTIYEMQKGYELIDKTIEHGKTLAKKRVLALLYSKDLLETEVRELVERISYDIPPNEIGVGKTQRSANWASAILAAWCWAIHGKRGKVPLSADDRTLLNTITQRGVESILMKRLYDEQRAKR